ncbi:hypothetical protein NL516_26895, partial [Klebsiella pneumoniae]|nr:hypothetical protein [Klebsiella pneumoniae]
FGTENEILKPVAYAADYSQRLACPEGIVTYEGIAEALDILLDSLCERLEFESKGVRKLELECLRFDGGVQSTSIGTTYPSRDRKHLF